MDGIPRECQTCVHWKKDGRDGICFGGEAPSPRILPSDERYTVIWPRTNADERCRNWEGDTN